MYNIQQPRRKCKSCSYHTTLIKRTTPLPRWFQRLNWYDDEDDDGKRTQSARCVSLSGIHPPKLHARLRCSALPTPSQSLAVILGQNNLKVHVPVIMAINCIARSLPNTHTRAAIHYCLKTRCWGKVPRRDLHHQHTTISGSNNAAFVITISQPVIKSHTHVQGESAHGVSIDRKDLPNQQLLLLLLVITKPPQPPQSPSPPLLPASIYQSKGSLTTTPGST